MSVSDILLRLGLVLALTATAYISGFQAGKTYGFISGMRDCEKFSKSANSDRNGRSKIALNE